jgi:hypothetical protein
VGAPQTLEGTLPRSFSASEPAGLILEAGNAVDRNRRGAVTAEHRPLSTGELYRQRPASAVPLRGYCRSEWDPRTLLEPIQPSIGYLAAPTECSCGSVSSQSRLRCAAGKYYEHSRIWGHAYWGVPRDPHAQCEPMRSTLMEVLLHLSGNVGSGILPARP